MRKFAWMRLPFISAGGLLGMSILRGVFGESIKRPIIYWPLSIVTVIVFGLLTALLYDVIVGRKPFTLIRKRLSKKPEDSLGGVAIHRIAEKRPFEAILGVFPLSLAGFRAKDRLGVKIENGNRRLVIYDLWLRDNEGRESRNLVMRSHGLQGNPLELQPNEDHVLHFLPTNPWTPGEPTTVCVQVDGQTGRIYEFPTEMPPLPR